MKRPPKTLAEIQQTAWAREFKNDSPVSYPMALNYARQEGLEVFIDEGIGVSGETVWVIHVLDDPSFWMDVKTTKNEARQVCVDMGWKLR
jgi:hypothetical protein